MSQQTLSTISSLTTKIYDRRNSLFWLTPIELVSVRAQLGWFLDDLSLCAANKTELYVTEGEIIYDPLSSQAGAAEEKLKSKIEELAADVAWELATRASWKEFQALQDGLFAWQIDNPKRLFSLLKNVIVKYITKEEPQ